uniref:hypothetical protein n=1 Tax=Hydrogenophaga sp. OTU3427 TaxID=3043856 RepID=UPI00313E0B53
MGHHGIFGQFDGQHRWVQCMCFQQAVQPVRKAVVAQLAGRHIDGYRRWLYAHGTPAQNVADHTGGDTFPNTVNDAGALSNGNELGWGDRSQFGVGPANQCFRAGNGPTGNVQFGLVVDVKLPRHQRLAQAGAQMLVTLQFLFQRLGRILELVLAQLFRLVHRGVRGSQKAVGIDAVPGVLADADAHGDKQFMVAAVARLGKPLNDLFTHQVKGLDILAFQHHSELVTTQASHDVGVPEATPQPPSHLDQQGITHIVAQRVVDGLEIVEVDEQDGEHAVVALRPDDRLTQVRLQAGAVGQTGEIVLVDQAPQMTFGAHALDLGAGTCRGELHQLSGQLAVRQLGTAQHHQHTDGQALGTAELHANVALRLQRSGPGSVGVELLQALRDD